MRQVPVEEGLWGFRVENYPATGIALRKHPSDRQDNFVRPKVVFLPSQKIVCDKRVGPSSGVNFYRVQGTNGWVFDKRGATRMLIPESFVQEGLRVYRALANLAIRRKPFVSDKTRTEISVPKKCLVAVDLVRECPDDVENGPYLKLADGSGWVFECKTNEAMMEQVPVQDGCWKLVVANSPVGIALRYHLRDKSDLCKTSTIYPPGHILECDKKVVSPEDGVNFYHVRGANGWAFDRRGDHAMLHEQSTSHISPSESFSSSWPIDYVQRTARSMNLVEIAHNQTSCLVSFRTNENVRINVYYTTRTVGTCMDHPVQGKTQLFRRNCTDAELAEIMRCPRVHTGKGYQRKRSRSISGEVRRTREESLCKGDEEALRESLLAFNEELRLVSERRREVLRHLADINDGHAKEATVVQERTETRTTEIVKFCQAKQEELDKKKRGDRISTYVWNSDEMNYSSSARLFAMGGTAAFVIESNFWDYTSDLPDGLHTLVHTRAASHPAPVYVALGSLDRYYVEFANGKSNWNAENSEVDDIIYDSDNVQCVAFGSARPSYAVIADGTTHWGDVPPRCEKLLYSSGRGAVHSISLGPDGEYFISWKSGEFTGGGWSNYLNDEMVWLKRNGWHVRDVKFGDRDTFNIRYSSYPGKF